MDARRYLARELKKRGFTFTQTNEASPCLKELQAEVGGQYTGWVARLESSYKEIATTHVVHVSDCFVYPDDQRDMKYMLRVISSDLQAGKSWTPPP